VSAPEPVMACSDCGAEIKPSKRRKGTRCKRCTAIAVTRDPANQAKRSAALRRVWADPAQRASRVASMTEANRRPEMVAIRREHGKRLDHARRFAVPACGPAGSPSRVSAGKALTEFRLGWCPPGWRDAYRRLCYVDGFRAAEARHILEDQIAADVRALQAGTLPPGRTIEVREAARWVRERAEKVATA